MTKLTNPVPVFYDGRGVPLMGGHLYIGMPDVDPQASPINVFWDEALTIPATQPLRTIGGLIVNGVTPASAFFAETDYSLRVTDSNDILVEYSPSLLSAIGGYQPYNADLAAIANQGTTIFGRQLLSLSGQGDLVDAVGLPPALPAAGGTVTGDISRQGAGSHTYWVDSAMTSGRVFVTAAGAADPTSQPGDLWLSI